MIVDLIKVVFWYGFQGLVRALPISTTSRLAGPLGRVAMRALGLKRHLIREELLACKLADPAGADAVTAATFSCQLRGRFKMCYLPHLTAGNVEQLLPVEGRPHLDNALKAGHGALLMNSHLGPFLLAVAGLGHRGYPCHQIAIQGDQFIVGERKGFDRLAYHAKFRAVEGNIPVTFINAVNGPMVVRSAIRALQRNEVVFYPSTGRGGEQWAEVDFLGRRCRISPAPFRMAAAAGAPILPIFALDADPLSRIIIEEPLAPVHKDRIEVAMQEYATVLERYVRRYPEQMAHFLFEMRMNCWWDDHPFFTNYPAEDLQRRGRRPGQ